MYKSFSLILCCSLFISIYASDATDEPEQMINLLETTELKGSGNIIQEERQLPLINKISVSDNFDIDVTIEEKQIASGTPTQLVINSDDNLLPLIETEVKENTLFVRFKNEGNKDPLLPLSFKNTLIHTKKNPSIHITLSSLNEILLRGSSKIHVKNLNEKHLSLITHGSSSSKISGNVGQLTTKMSGSSELDARELICEQIEFKASGSTRSTLNVRNSLNGHASGAAKIVCYGKPSSQKVELNGASELKSA